LWHGFTGNYIAYGLYHATALVICDAFGRWRKAHPERLTGRWWKYVAQALTILCVSFGFWMFSAHGWVQAGPDSPGFFTTKFLGNHHRQEPLLEE
jgi:D-alanyl-lipoteichoic acid acyltransferase DltB (MBOAT superfamily)